MNKSVLGAVVAAALMSVAASVHAAETGLSSFEMKADTNGDGKVSFEEFRAAHEAKLKARFNRLDANGDGFVDFKEKKIAKEKQRQKEVAEKEAIREEIRKEYAEDRKTRKRHFYKYK